MQVHIADHRLSVRQTDLPMLSAKDDRMQEPRLRVRRTIGDRSPIAEERRRQAPLRPGGRRWVPSRVQNL
jgi:hypothetical protein